MTLQDRLNTAKYWADQTMKAITKGEDLWALTSAQALSVSLEDITIEMKDYETQFREIKKIMNEAIELLKVKGLHQP